MNVEKYDRIVVTDEQFKKINEWHGVKGEAPKNVLLKPLPFEQGIVVIKDPIPKQEGIKVSKLVQKTYSYLYYFKLNESESTLLHEVYGKYSFSEDLMPLVKFETSASGKYRILESKVVGDAKEIVSIFMINFFSLMNYIASRDKERINVTRTTVKTKHGRGGKTKHRKIITLTDKLYVYDKSESKEKRQVNWKAESWGVRGHWRTYKSGKKTWVKPHTKGEGVKEGKEYRLS